MIEEAVDPAFKAILVENEGSETTAAHFVASRVRFGAATLQYSGQKERGRNFLSSDLL
ncbi:hypothetical protein [Rhodoblastus sp.]|uniref:hypothetical protein n=1 Tax=Rhodoblastus sp. TaxID=1962975 RepID=UPI003F9667F5